jgi:ATP synthase protein I
VNSGINQNRHTQNQAVRKVTMKNNLNNDSEIKKTSDYSIVGLMFPVSIAAGLAIGYYLDKWLKTSPYLLILFTLYGVVGGFWNLIKITRQDGKKK